MDDRSYNGSYYDLAREWIVALINKNHDAVFSDAVRDVIDYAENYLRHNFVIDEQSLRLISDFNNGYNLDKYPDHPKSCTIDPMVSFDAEYDSEKAKDRLYFNVMIDSVFKKQLGSVSGKGRFKESFWLDSYAGELLEIVVRFKSDWCGMGGTIRLNSVMFSV